MTPRKECFVPAAFAALVLAFFFFSASSLFAQSAIRTGSHRLCDLQADISFDNAHNGLVDDDPDDGGWDWKISYTAQHHSVDPSPTNIYGVTALGLLNTLQDLNGKMGSISLPPYIVGIDNMGTFAPFGPDLRPARFLQACLDAHIRIAADPSIDSAPDIVFLLELDGFRQAPNQGYSALAKARYDAKVAAYGGVLLFAEFLRDYRGSHNQEGFIPFDLGWLARAALGLDDAFPGQGYDQDAATYVQVMVDDINNPNGYFDINKPSETGYTIGLACGAAALKRIDLYPSLMDDMIVNLLTMQKTNGSFRFQGASGPGSAQATAYAVIALALEGSSGSLAAAQDASDWFAANQDPAGGWHDQAGKEIPEVDGEILQALVLVPPRGGGGDGPPTRSRTAEPPPPAATPFD